jgi:hypothetical protein
MAAKELGPLPFLEPLEPQTPIIMQPTRALLIKPNLLLCLDAFNTLIKPSIPIHVAYAQAAARHGIQCSGEEKELVVKAQFKSAFKGESQRNPNYGRVTGLGAEKWWGNVSFLFSTVNLKS